MDVLNGLFNLLLITLVGFLIAFSPMIVIVNVMVVLKSSRPILRTLVLMAGMAAPLIILAAAAILFIHPDSQISFSEIGNRIDIPPIIGILLGIWLFGMGLRRWQYYKAHGGPKKSPHLIMKNPPDKLSGLFMFAFFKSILSVTNIFAILFVTTMIVTKSILPPFSILAILWVILIGLMPFGVILYFYFFKHERLELLSGEVDRLLKRNLDFAINLALMSIGGFFSLAGLIHIVTR